MSSYRLSLKRLMVIVLPTLVIVGVTACQPPADTTEVEFRVPVTVEEVGVATVEDHIVTTGTLRAPELVTLTVMTAGLLQIEQSNNRRLAEGDHVKAGDLIGTITGEDVRLATRLQAARQKLESAEINLAATSALLEENLVPITQYGQDKNAYEEAKLDYERSLHTEDRNRIVTPIDGVILKLARDNEGQLMANGQLVAQGQAIAQIAPLDFLVADVDLVGKDIARVHVGLQARANYHAWPERDFTGEVLRLAPTVNEKTRALRAEVQISNEDGLLRPGMFVEVTLVSEIREQVPVVARRSLTERGGRRVVFVLNGQRAEQREVKLGLGNDQLVEIRSGIDVGDRVVVLGLETLTDQMPVRITSN